MLLHVLAGRHAVDALEEGGEGGGVGEAAGIDNLGDVHILRGEQVGCLLQAQGTDEIVGRLARELLHLTVHRQCKCRPKSTFLRNASRYQDYCRSSPSL